MNISLDTTPPHDYEPEPRDWSQCSLTEIADAYRTDKGSLDHNYTKIYEKYFGSHDWFLGPLSLLEIGVACGASLKTWSRWMPMALITGVDINPACADLCKEYDNIKIVIANAAETVIDPHWDNELTGNRWDIVIDDGSHVARDMSDALKLQWPNLKSGGLWCIEDTACTYVDGYHRPRRLGNPHERILYRQLIDGFLTPLDLGVEVEWLHAYKQLVIVKKK